ncbi:hypothetical protein Bca52824_088452 [Brassica carinata]|uniref:TIR domain-containing protein n=1 Tax=Brassica carinata TaxID=52824 RepID=A0A8X7PA49_BRACI|nr:hypothetical protein Bca52824_088452 [Brassica carinata]
MFYKGTKVVQIYFQALRTTIGQTHREGLVSFLPDKLGTSGINYYVDYNKTRGYPITIVFRRIRESGVAIVFFSAKYPESCWCLDELVEIKKQMEIRSIIPFPVFYKVRAESVKKQTGCFGHALLRTEDLVRKKVDRGSNKSILEAELKIWERRQAIASVGGRMGFPYKHSSDEVFLSELVVKVKELRESAWVGFEQVSISSDIKDLITKPSIHINGSLSTDHLVFLDLNSIKNPLLAQTLFKPGQAGNILLVLLGFLEYYNVEDVDFKPRLLSRKPRLFPDVLAMAESNENTRNRLGVDKNSDCSLTCFSLLCNIMKRFEMMINPPPPRVFISFGEKQLEMNLVSSLKTEFESNEISVYIEDETKERIKESKVAIVVFSDKYPESPECLDELVEIKKLMDVGEITPFPIFYKLKDVPRLAQSVKQLKGCFRNRLLKIEQEVRKTVNRDNVNSILDTEARIWEWRQAISSISSRPGLSNENSSDPVFFTDVVTKVKKLFEFKAIPKKSSSYIITNQVIEEKPIMHRQKTAPAIPTVKSVDDDLFYSLPSFLQALDLEITDFEGFTEMHSGLISLSLKRHSNLVCLNLGSLEKLVHFRCSDSFEFLSQGFGLNHPGISRFEEPSRVLEIESSQPQQRFDNVLSSHLKITNIT